MFWLINKKIFFCYALITKGMFNDVNFQIRFIFLQFLRFKEVYHMALRLGVK